MSRNYKYLENPRTGYTQECITIAHAARLTGKSLGVTAKNLKGLTIEGKKPRLVFCDAASGKLGIDLYSVGFPNQNYERAGDGYYA